jgi:hypothetical protein
LLQTLSTRKPNSFAGLKVAYAGDVSEPWRCGRIDWPSSPSWVKRLVCVFVPVAPRV